MHVSFAILNGTIHSPSKFVTETGVITGANRFNAYKHAKYNIHTRFMLERVSVCTNT